MIRSVLRSWRAGPLTFRCERCGWSLRARSPWVFWLADRHDNGCPG